MTKDRERTTRRLTLHPNPNPNQVTKDRENYPYPYPYPTPNQVTASADGTARVYNTMTGGCQARHTCSSPNPYPCP